ncbi:hypothetical protein HRbin36_01981 [bacterium HR36]|nr:hypothetical protein HRbin36_01981 [bacterium HR36]
MSTVLGSAETGLPTEPLARLLPANGSRQTLGRGGCAAMLPGFACDMRRLCIAAKIIAHATDNCLRHKVTETGVITQRDAEPIRMPDGVFASFAHLPHVGLITVSAVTLSDLVVAIFTPHDSLAASPEIMLAYLTYEKRLVWIGEPKARTVTVYRGWRNEVAPRGKHALVGGEVPPGFRTAMELFQPQGMTACAWDWQAMLAVEKPRYFAG